MGNQRINQSFKEGSEYWAFQLFNYYKKALLVKNNKNYRDLIVKTREFIEKLEYFGFYHYSSRLNTLILRCFNNNDQKRGFSVYFPLTGLKNE